MNQVQTVTATFSRPTFNLDVQGSGNGAGTVVSTSPAGGINCTINGTTESGDCSEVYGSGTQVRLTANAASGSAFSSWSGCSSSTNSCTVTMSQARTVTTSFSVSQPITYNLSVQGGGNGAGTVVSTSPAGGINCTINGTTESGDCSESYKSGVYVILKATASYGSTFIGWGSTVNDPPTYGTADSIQTLMSESRTFYALFMIPGPPEITYSNKSYLGTSKTCKYASGETFTGYLYQVSFLYDDPDGDVIKGQGDTAVLDHSSNVTQWTHFSGDGFSGSISYFPCYTTDAKRTVIMSLIDAMGHPSNSLSIELPSP
jgi:hypothetical protein